MRANLPWHKFNGNRHVQAKTRVQFKIQSETWDTFGYIYVTIMKVAYGRYMDVWQPAISCEHSTRAQKCSTQKRCGSCKGNTKWNYKQRKESHSSEWNTSWNGKLLVRNKSSWLYEWQSPWSGPASDSGTARIAGKWIISGEHDMVCNCLWNKISWRSNTTSSMRVRDSAAS